jgi:excisionase family DNA binding protein
MPVNAGVMFTVAEAARLLSVHPMTIRRAIETGEIPAVRVRRAVRIPGASLDNLLDAARAPRGSA